MIANALNSIKYNMKLKIPFTIKNRSMRPNNCQLRLIIYYLAFFWLFWQHCCAGTCAISM